MSSVASHFPEGFRHLSDIESLERACTLDDLPRSTYDALRQTAERVPDRPALIFLPDARALDRVRTYSYREWLAGITQTANLLADLGVNQSQSVGLLLPNLPETHWCLWGGEAAGAVCPVNPMLSVAAQSDILQAARARVLVTVAEADFWEKALTLCAHLPTLKTLLVVRSFGAKASYANAVPDNLTVLDFHEQRVLHPDDRLAFGRTIAPDDVASYFHTGGTTGLPKLACHTHRNEVANAWMTGQCLGQLDGLVFFCGLPLFHVNAMMATGLVPWLFGATVVLGTARGYRDPDVLPNFWRIVEKFRINTFSGVPTVYSALLQVPPNGADLSSLRFGICGAAPMPVEVFRQFERRTGIRILEGYGLTEGACVSTLNPLDGERQIGSIGLRLPFQQVRLVRTTPEGNYAGDCAADEVGLLVIKGANVFAGYVEAAHNERTFLEIDGTHWLVTGDLGRQDEAGYYWLTGRQKELIIRGGHNIDPKTIEEVLHRHPAVALAAAVGRPDAHAGELPVAYVQLQAGQQVTEADLLAFAQTHVAERVAVPKAIRVVDYLPLTAVGKLFKPALVARETESVAREALAAVGIETKGLRCASEAGRGLVCRVELWSATDAEQARAVLGQFAFGSEVVAEA